MRQNNKMFSVLFSGLCACWPGESLAQPQADGGQWQQAGWLPLLPGTTGTVPHSHRCPQLPPTCAGTEISAQNNEYLKGRGEAGREWRPCSYFLIMKLLTFNSLTPENPFVNCFNKSKTWYKTEDSRLFLGGLPTLFSCHLSQDRISTLEAAV